VGRGIDCYRVSQKRFGVRLKKRNNNNIDIV